MYQIGLLLTILSAAYGANYQRYSESSTRYPAYTTIANLYNQPQVYKSGTYERDISNFPSRYPNSDTGFSSGYNNGAVSNVYNQPGYSTVRYGDTYGKDYNTYERPYMNDIRGYCVNRSPQTAIWVDSLAGMWYGVEYIQHLGGDSMVDYTRTCIVIHISEPKDRPSTENQLYHVQHISAKFRQDYRHIRLLWDEAGRSLEFSLYFRNDTAGYWQVFGGQNGTIPEHHNYQQFSGTVQVLKAVNDHLLLNFCQEGVNGRQPQLYSVLFSREPGQISLWEIESVHTLLQTKQLSVASRRMVCGNSAMRHVQGFVISILACIFSYVLFSS